MIRRVAAAAALGCLLALGRTASAQAVPSVRPSAARPDTVRPATPLPATPLPADTARRGATRPDTTRPDTTRRDTSAAARPLVTWAPTDSIYEALLKRAGYQPVRYQGDTLRFELRGHVLTLTGKPAAIDRDETMLVGYSVVYNDSTQIVLARPATGGRDSVVLRSPQQSDIVVRDTIRYDIASGKGIISGFKTAVEQGENWRVSGARGAVVTDTTVKGGRIFYVHDGAITSCQDSVPHYHFQARDIKYVQKNLLVVRPAVLYIGDVPVLWLPFIFQDARSGRRSGILTPRFGFAELVRNSPNYRRSLENLGYYVNMGKYVDAQAWFDWRSGAHGESFDPGWVRFNAETRYRVIDRFMQGRFSSSYLAQRDGSRNTAISLQHEQSFNQNRRLSANVNWVQSTTPQRQNTINPNAVLGTISSQLNLQDRFGPFTFSTGGTRKQYPGRSQVDQDFPNVNLSASTISVTPWLDWTPTASFSNSQSFEIDQGTQFDSVFVRDESGSLVGQRVKASRRNTNITFDTPLKIFDFALANSFRFTEDVQDFPQTRVIYRDVNDTSTKETRVFNQTYTSNIFYQTSFGLPRFLQGTWNVSPTVSISNVDPSFGTLVRTERTGGRWVSQGLPRLSYGVSAAPTFYAFPPGFGPVERFRHSINPAISFSYSPRAKVRPEFLDAIGGTTQGYLGALPQSQVSLQLSTNLEAKMRRKAPKPIDSLAARTDSGAAPNAPPGGAAGASRAGAAAAGGAPGSGAEGDKVRLLSVNFTGLSYDFIIADSVGKSLFNSRGITNQTFGYSVHSDLVPALNLQTNYSLFLDNPQSDSAVFKPYLTDVNVSFSLDRNSALFASIGRLLGISSSTPAANSPPIATTPNGNPRGGDAFFSQQATAQQVAGSASRNAPFDIPNTQSWQASFTFTSARQRPDLRGNIITIDPTIGCLALRQTGNVIAYEQCVGQANTAPPAGSRNTGISTLGAPIFRQPPTQSLTANTSFHLTQKWAAQWNTSYDLVRSQFASNVVSLQRELHDWRAVFAFTQSPNGNFAFNFFVALKAEPDLKFDYNRNTYRSSGAGGFQ